MHHHWALHYNGFLHRLLFLHWLLLLHGSIVGCIFNIFDVESFLIIFLIVQNGIGTKDCSTAQSGCTCNEAYLFGHFFLLHCRILHLFD